MINVERYINAAERHGIAHGLEREESDLQQMLRVALHIMAEEQRELWAAHPEVRAALEWED